MCDSVAVMYAGKIVERAPTRQLLAEPRHPYTEALLRSVPDVGRPVARLVSIEGQPPPITSFPPGCRFHPRCGLYERLGKPASCRDEEPQLRKVAHDQYSACHYADDLVDSAQNASVED